MGWGWHFYHSCLYIKIQEQYTLSNIITLYYTGNKFLQSGLEGNTYNNNKSFNHSTLNHAVPYATVQNTELDIYQETIHLAQIKIKLFQECTYVTDKYWPILMIFYWAKKSLI